MKMKVLIWLCFFSPSKIFTEKNMYFFFSFNQKVGEDVLYVPNIFPECENARTSSVNSLTVLLPQITLST